MSHSHTLAAMRPSRGAMRLFFSSLVIAVAGAAMGPVMAQSPAGGAQAMPAGMGPMGPMGRHGGMGHGGGHRIERMLDAVKATDAQRAQIRQLNDTARTELRAKHDAGRALREQSRQLMMAPTIDSNAVEQLRLQMLAQHEQVSKRKTQLMLDIAQVLTPEQRAQLGAMMAKRGGQPRGDMQREHRHPRGSDTPRS